MNHAERRVAPGQRALVAVLLSLTLVVPVLAGSVPAAKPVASVGPTASADDQARFLAGLPVAESSPLAALEQTPAFKEHAKELDARWAKLTEKRLTKMAAWAAQEIKPHINPTAPVAYLFGGPDAITVDVIYPEATSYVLCGLEVVGKVPRIEELPKAELANGLKNLRTSLHSQIDLSFFVTSEMSSELLRTQIRGVMPVVYLFLARNGNHVVDAQYVYIDAAGKMQEVPPNVTPDDGVPGFRVRFRRGDEAAVRELYYFRLDVTDSALPKKPGFFKYLVSLGPVNSFLKAASFILHDNHFSVTRSYLLDHSASILQDDSGVPFRFFKDPKWSLFYFGEYSPPRLKVFRGHYQPEMKKAFEQGPTKELPFTTGYSHDHGSNMLLAVTHGPGPGTKS